MTIYLYSTQDESEKMNKTLTLLDTVTGNARDINQIGMETTEFLLNTDDASLIENSNYMYVEDIHRYYFIGDKKSRVNGLWLVPGAVDPLMSFKDQIAELEGIVKRSASISDALIIDEQDILYQNPHKVYKNFPAGFGNNSSVLIMTI